MAELAGSLDANVLLRLLLNDVPAEHAAALELVGRGSFKVSDVAVAEVVFVLDRHYNWTCEQIHRLVGRLLQQPPILGSAQVGPSLDRYKSAPKLSFEDCLLVEHAGRDRAEPLWTFDRKLANQTKAKLVPDGAAGDG